MTKKRTLLLLLVVLVFAAALSMTAYHRMGYRQIAKDSAEAAQLAGLPEKSPTNESKEAAGPIMPLPEEAAALAEVDLEALQAVNEDVVGWIAIPGTELSYPLVQGEDNQYYLTHTWRKEVSSGGAVFLESTNSCDLSDFHTIVYAHRMNNDSMFGTLKYYKDIAFWKTHPRVYVVTEDGVFCYDIFSAEEESITGLVYRLDLEERELEAEFLQECVEDSVIDTGIVPDPGVRVLTLSTCTGNGHDTRWVIHGTLVQVYSQQTA